MSGFTEKTASEDFILEKLQELGWTYKEPTELRRDDFEEPLLKQNLEEALKSINDVKLKEEDIDKIISKLEFLSSDREGVKQTLQYLKEGIHVKLEDENSLRKIDLIDEDPEENDYIVSNQVIHRNYDNEIKPDIVLYVNGIPLVIIECKDPTNPKVDWETAYKQIKRYEDEVPELFKFVQFSIGTGETAKYFPNVPWKDDVHIYEWKKGDMDVLEATLEIITSENLFNFIMNYTFVREEKGEATKVMGRYMQYRATERIFNRVIGNLKGENDKKSGLVWHWQGSGKTLTMLFAMHKLFNHDLLNKPLYSSLWIVLR